MNLSSVPQWQVAVVAIFAGYGLIAGVLWLADRINKRHELASKLAAILGQHGYTRVAAILDAYALGNLQKALHLCEALHDDLKDPAKLNTILDEVFDKRLVSVLDDKDKTAEIIKKIVGKVGKVAVNAAIAAIVP